MREVCRRQTTRPFMPEAETNRGTLAAAVILRYLFLGFSEIPAVVAMSSIVDMPAHAIFAFIAC